MIIKGKLRHEDLGTGAWVLETEEGERIMLVGDVPSKLQGREVSVQGREVEAMGFAMVGGRTMEVSRISEG